MLQKEPDIDIVGEAGTIQEAVDKTLKLLPDILLLDLFLPDGIGIKAIQAILDQQPATKIVVLSISDEDEFVLSAIRFGAKGYLLKDNPVSQIISSLRAVQRGELAISRGMTKRIIEDLIQNKSVSEHQPIDIALKSLSQREREVLELIGLNSTNAEIAERLSISEHTVKIHIRNIYKKLNIMKRQEAVRFSQRLWK